MKPNIWKRGNHWYCCSVLTFGHSEHTIGEGDSPASAYADWRYS